MADKSLAILSRIIGEIDFVLDASRDMTENHFASDVFSQHALTMAILNIGELAGRLDATFRTQHSNIPWQQIIGFRNAAAHSYDGLDMEIVWQTIERDLPNLRLLLLEILAG
jgi:uncharacterized protein with HEPN domain